MRTVAQSQRERDCGRLICIEDDPEIRVRNEEGARRASFNGLLRCGHVWTCAPCSQRIRAKQAKRIGYAVEFLGGNWCMLTLTVRHDVALRLHGTMRGAKKAWRGVRQRRDWRNRWKSLAHAPVTAFEITDGENGWHPHIHVAFRLKRDVNDDDRRILEQLWTEAVERELGARCRPNERGVTWSRSFDAAKEGERALYVSKLGLEVSDAGLAKQARSHWDIARRAAKGDKEAYARWCEYNEATKGLHVLQLSPEASDAAKKGAESQPLRADEQPFKEPENITVPSHIIRAMRAREVVDRTVFYDALRSAELGGRAGFLDWVKRTFPPRPVSGYAWAERSPP